MAALIFAIPIVLTALFITVPTFALISLITGLDAVLISELWISAVFALIAVASAVVFLLFKPGIGRTGQILLLIDLPFSLLTAVSLASPESGWTLLMCCISVAAVFIMYAKFVPDGNFKAVSAVISVLLAIAFAVMSVWWIVASLIGDSTDVRRVASPDGAHEAVIVARSNLFGESTEVRIDSVNSEFSLILADFYKKPRVIFSGEGYLAQTAEVSWRDDETVIIDHEEYRAN